MLPWILVSTGVSPLGEVGGGTAQTLGSYTAVDGTEGRSELKQINCDNLRKNMNPEPGS